MMGERPFNPLHSMTCRSEEDPRGAAGQHHAAAGQAGVQGGEHLQRHRGQPDQRHQHCHAQRQQCGEGQRGR